MSRRKSVKENIAPPEQAYLVGVEWKEIPKGRYVPGDWPVEDPTRRRLSAAARRRKSLTS